MTVTARVRVTLDIEVTDVWDDDARASQVRDQASVSAIGTLRQRMVEVRDINGTKVFPTKMTIVGEPEVTMIMKGISCK